MMKHHAIVYADKLYGCADGKTAHGLVRYSKRFTIGGVVDSSLAEGDAGEILDGTKRNIPLFNSLQDSIEQCHPDTFIIGAVSEGGVLPPDYDQAVDYALRQGLHVVSGLHQFLSDETRFSNLAKTNNCTIIDVRKIFRDHKRFYSGDIKDVPSTRIALIGTDSAIGKRTLAVLVNNELIKRGHTSDMIFTGQTGWLQGWPHGTVVDAMINDFVAGGIEGALLESWNDDHPEFMIIEGQGSLVHPFFPGGFEILAAGNVHGFLLVDAPCRPHLDGFPEYPMPNPKRVVQIARLLTEKPLLGIGINRERMTKGDIDTSKQRLRKTFQVPVVEPFLDGVQDIVEALEKLHDKG